MARVLTIFSILIGLATAFLGWKTREQALELQNNLSAAKSARTAAEGKQKAAEKDRDETKAKLEETEGSLKKAQEDLTNTKGELQNLRTDYEKAKADVEEKSKRLAEVEAAMKSLTPSGTTPEQMGAQVKELSDAKTRLEKELEEAKQVQAALKDRADQLDAQVIEKERTIKTYQGPIVRQGLTGKVLAYNPGWNFVVLNIGDKAGLRNGVQLVVTRGGAMVGKVRVTTVEPSTAIADVLPGTLAKGESVQPGDSVVFQGRTQ